MMTPAALGAAFDIPGYRLVRQLGQGGMATVYLATQTSLGRQVAIKVLAAERTPSEDLVKRFENETRTIARLDHPHIVDIYEVGRASNGQLFYTMPYLPNGDLSNRQYADNPRAALSVLRAIAQALAYAHDQGIVHRDVKPENVLFDKLDRPLLADFGIALTTHASVRMTREGATLGSTGYMSPEQARGLAIDGRSDLYSLGVLGYELLTGELPFQGPDPLAVALAHVEQTAPRLPPTRRPWQEFIDCCMAKEPDQRYQDANAVLAALDGIEAELDGRGKRRNGLQSLRDRLATIPAGLLVGAAALLGIASLLVLLVAGEPAPLRVTPSPATATIPAPANAPASAGAALPIADAADIDRHLREAGALLRKQQLLAPAGANAVEHYLQILNLAPGHSEARAGIAAVLAALHGEFAAALRKNDAVAANASLEQARTLIDKAAMQGSGEADAAAKALVDAFNARLIVIVRELDAPALAALQPAATALGASSPEALQRWQAVNDEIAKSPVRGTVFRDNAGPEMLLVPASHDKHRIDHAYALSRTEVTRADYARFVQATRRAASKCREPLRPLSRLKSLSWQDPDFRQGNDNPVVCVSWLDAYAYTRWLSARTGARYRLPTEAEWLHAARGMGDGNACGLGNIADASKDKSLSLANRYKCNDGNSYTSSVGRYAASDLGLRDLFGNASEWTLDCGAAAPLDRLLQENACPERIFRGTSWRDGSDELALQRRGSVDTDLGYTTIGFRVLRELSPDKPPPLAVR